MFVMTDKVPVQLGWLDANLFIHPLHTDEHSEACRRILNSIQRGDSEGWLDPVTLHELSYVLLRFFHGDRGKVLSYLLPVIAIDGIKMHDKICALETLKRWEQGLSFGDARIATIAKRTGFPVCTVNARDFAGLENTYDRFKASSGF